MKSVENRSFFSMPQWGSAPKEAAAEARVEQLAALARPSGAAYTAFRGGGVAGQYLISDISTIVRSFVSLFPQNTGVAMPAMGITTGTNAVTGGITVHTANHRREIAEQLGDYEGTCGATVDMVRGMTQAAAGTVFVGQRILSTVTIAKGIEASAGSKSLVGRVTHWLSIVGSVLFSCFFVILGVVASMRLQEVFSLRSEMEKAGTTPEEKVAFLEEKLRVTEQMIRDGLGPDADAVLETEALSRIKEAFKEEMAEEGCTEAELEGRIRDLFGGGAEAKRGLALVGLQVKVELEALKRQTILGRSLGGDVLKGLLEGEDKQKLCEMAKSEMNKNLAYWSAMVAGCVFGLPAMVLSMIFLSGPLAVLGTTLMVLSGAAMLLIDGYDTIQALKTEERGKYERLLLLASSVILFAAVTTISIVSGGAVPLAIAVAIGVPWLAINVVLISRLATDRSGIEDEKQLERKKRQKTLFKEIINIY